MRSPQLGSTICTLQFVIDKWTGTACFEVNVCWHSRSFGLFLFKFHKFKKSIAFFRRLVTWLTKHISLFEATSEKHTGSFTHQLCSFFKVCNQTQYLFWPLKADILSIYDWWFKAIWDNCFVVGKGDLKRHRPVSFTLINLRILFINNKSYKKKEQPFFQVTEVVIIILSITNGSVTPGFYIIIIYVILTAGLITSVLLFT